jgi:hypothetical protein
LRAPIIHAPPTRPPPDKTSAVRVGAVIRR